MAWYDDQNKTLFVGTYANEKQLQWDMEAAKRRGWVVQEPGAADGGEDEPIIGSETSGANGVAVREKGRLQVTFVRAEDWLANRKQEIASALQSEAARAADAKEARFVKTAAELEKAEQQLKGSIDAALASAGDPARDQAERQLLNDLRQVIVRRQATLKAMEEAIKEMQTAVAVGASEFARSIASHMKAQVAGQARLEAEQALLAAQDVVARAAKEWRDANDRRRATEEELRKRTADFEAKDAALNERLTGRNAALDELGRLVR
jgi:hypothetical protein